MQPSSPILLAWATEHQDGQTKTLPKEARPLNDHDVAANFVLPRNPPLRITDDQNQHLGKKNNNCYLVKKTTFRVEDLTFSCSTQTYQMTDTSTAPCGHNFTDSHIYTAFALYLFHTSDEERQRFLYWGFQIGIIKVGYTFIGCQLSVREGLLYLH